MAYGLWHFFAFFAGQFSIILIPNEFAPLNLARLMLHGGREWVRNC